MAHTTYPPDLPVPEDDGACNHLTSLSIPSLHLPQSSPQAPDPVDPSALPGLSIIFIYPRTGAPGETVPKDWDAIPGARGCTPQACSFRDNLGELKALGVSSVYGLSTQGSEYQAEVRERLGLPYELLSDEKLEFARALRLPTFEWQGTPVLKRVTLAVEGGEVVKYWYPIFPPDKNVDDVLEWLRSRK